MTGETPIPYKFTAPPEIDVSVLIPAFNEELLIDRVHESFRTVGRESYEIVVCDNNSTDRTGEIATAKGAVVVPEPHNQIARARNTAAKSARGKWLIFLDGDTFITPELLAQTLRVLEAGSICAGGSTLKFDRDDIGWFPKFLFLFWNSISWFVNLAAGSYIFCYREAWGDVGGFDEEIYAGEEIYFSWSLKDWARPRKLKFKVLSGTPVITSARKLEWYDSWQLFWHILRMMMPGSVRRRESCDLWYSRPGDTAGR